MIGRKDLFEKQLKSFVSELSDYAEDARRQWTIKGFIDRHKNIYSISADTKIISKILEIHLFPKILQFASQHGYRIVLARHQNYYPDLSFVCAEDESIRFAVDLKTTYRIPTRPDYCNGFTLGSHGEYFINRQSNKNIQYPYSSYLGHFCLGIIYDRVSLDSVNETTVKQLDKLDSIQSVIKNLQFFVAEKWKLASDKSGSGNTANIGSIKRISSLISGNGVFSRLGETWFDDYWMNYRKIYLPPDSQGNVRTINNLKEFVEYRKGDTSLIVNSEENS